MAVDYMAIRMVTGVGAPPNLSAFSAMVQMISGASHKLFLRLGIGDGAFPKSAKMRQIAPFWRCDSHRRVGPRIENSTIEPTSEGVESRKLYERTHRPT